MRQLPAPAIAESNTPAIDRMQSRVDAAAFALIREGRNPTVSLVRARMGGASPNLVAPALQRWRQTFAAQLDENAGSALEVLPPGVLELVQALWSRALFEAHRVRDDSPSGAESLDRLNAAITELLHQMAPTTGTRSTDRCATSTARSTPPSPAAAARTPPGGAQASSKATARVAQRTRQTLNQSLRA
jgi:hypothetical protein